MKAFVIMPYGGEEEGKKKSYASVFRHIIKDSVELFDRNIEVVRQDYTNEGGHILSNVIQSLSEADLVIADLSELNWNVAYELGIRHTMNRKGTILMCNDETELPFDIQSLNILRYPKHDWLDDEEEIQRKLSAMIQGCLDSDRPDSPVHSEFPSLPETLTKAMGNTGEGDKKRIVELSKQMDALKEENEKLKDKIENAGLTFGEKEKEASIANELKKALESEPYTSDVAVSRLRQLVQEGKKEEFVNFLAKVLDDGYLDEYDCKEIYRFCRVIKIPKIIQIYLEKVTQFYPDNDELRGYLAKSYCEDYNNREKSKAMVNVAIGLTQKNGNYEFTKSVVSETMLGAFFDVYISLREYSTIITLSPLLLEKYPNRSGIIYRNTMTAYRNLENYDQAVQIGQALVQAEPHDDRNFHAFYLAHRYQGNDPAAYEALEKAISIDPNYVEYLYYMAGFICDKKIARVSPSGEIVKGIKQDELGVYALPFVFKALSISQKNQDDLNRAVNFMQRNNFGSYKAQLEQFLSGEDCGLDFAIVNYCYTR